MYRGDETTKGYDSIRIRKHQSNLLLLWVVYYGKMSLVSCFLIFLINKNKKIEK